MGERQDLRIDAAAAQADVEDGRALLVCAYDDEEKCRRYGLEGAMTLAELRALEGSLPSDREILFYCA
jgi:hypothetical protein